MSLARMRTEAVGAWVLAVAWVQKERYGICTMMYHDTESIFLALDSRSVS